MKTILVLAALLLGINLSAQEKHTITSGNERIDIKCSPVGNTGWCKEGEITSTLPIRVVFKRNDKTDADVYVKSLKFAYKKSEQGADVADLSLDGTWNWSSRAVYFITVYVNTQNIYYDSEKMRVGQGIDFIQKLGFPFSISSSTSGSAAN